MHLGIAADAGETEQTAGESSEDGNHEMWLRTRPPSGRVHLERIGER